MSKKPAVKPKTTKGDSKVSSSRTFSTSKDEAHTKLPKNDDVDKDEELARQLQVQCRIGFSFDIPGKI